MAATLSFRWLEILEKEFDKAFVDLDLLLGEVDPDQAEITYEGRQKMTALSAAFAQLCHKSQTIFQSNAKLEVSAMLLLSLLQFAGSALRSVVNALCGLWCTCASSLRYSFHDVIRDAVFIGMVEHVFTFLRKFK